MAALAIQCYFNPSAFVIATPLHTGIACDITALGKSLEQFEADYLTSSP